MLNPRFVTGSAAVLTAALIASSAAIARAGGVVGNGTPASCTEAALDAALVGGGTVTFACGGAPLSLPVTTSKAILWDTVIDGGNLVTIDAAGLPPSENNTFDVSPGVTLSVANLTLVNNTLSGAAAIANSGTLIAHRCTISGQSSGYGVFSQGASTTVSDCTLSGNATAVLSLGPVFVSGSTFSGNGTALWIAASGSGAATNSTFAGNLIGMRSLGATQVTNCTIARNTVAGIDGAPTLINTIVAENSGGNCNGAVGDGGHNLDDGSTCALAAPGSLSATAAGLSPNGLEENGGPTKTIALEAGSPAIDGGDATVCALSTGPAPVHGRDQRGMGRPGMGHPHCSIGAYEFSADGCPTAPAPCTTGFAKAVLNVKEEATGAAAALTARLIGGPATSQADFGDSLLPGGTAYRLCLYDDGGMLAGEVTVDRAGMACSGGTSPCWRAIGGAPPGGSGYKYKDRDLSAAGVGRIILKGGSDGRTKLLVSARGPNTPHRIAALLAATTAVTVQIHASDAPAPGCWSATLTHISTQTDLTFRAR